MSRFNSTASVHIRKRMNKKSTINRQASRMRTADNQVLFSKPAMTKKFTKMRKNWSILFMGSTNITTKNMHNWWPSDCRYLFKKFRSQTEHIIWERTLAKRSVTCKVVQWHTYIKIWAFASRVLVHQDVTWVWITMDISMTENHLCENFH